MKRLLSVLFVLFLACSAQAQLQISSFDVDVEGWRFDFGSAATTLTHDPTKDSTGNPMSGALRLDMAFNPTFGGENKAAVTVDEFPSPGTDVSGFTSLEVDIMVDPASATDAFGNHGYLQFAIRNGDGYSYFSEGGTNLMPSPAWFTRSMPVSGFSGVPNAMRALTMQLYGGPSQNINGTVTMWLDNVRFVPEPTGLGLMGVMGIMGLCLRRRGK